MTAPPELHYDLVGWTFGVGDIVALPPKHYRGLTCGIVVKLTPKKVVVRYRTWQGYLKDYICDPKSVVLLRINPKDVRAVTGIDIQEFIGSTNVPQEK